MVFSGSGKNRLLTTYSGYCLVIVLGPVKVSSLHDLLSSEILKLLGKTVDLQIICPHILFLTYKSLFLVEWVSDVIS